MPVYQYKCSKCDHKFELSQSFNAEPSASCPECNNGAIRLFIPVPIIFKGSGFYVTDNRKNGNGEAEKVPDTKQETKSETKQAEAKDQTVKNEVKEPEKL